MQPTPSVNIAILQIDEDLSEIVFLKTKKVPSGYVKKKETRDPARKHLKLFLSPQKADRRLNPPMGIAKLSLLGPLDRLSILICDL